MSESKARNRTLAEAEAQFRAGNQFAREGRIAEAVESFRRAVRLAPQAAQGHLHLGFALQKLGDQESAVSALRRALAIDAGLSSARFALGQSLMQLGRLDDAVEVYEAALRLEPNAATLHLALGTVFDRKRNFGKAIACYEHAVALDPSLSMAFNNLGAALNEQGRFVEAAQAYGNALRIEPRSAPIHVNLALCLKRQQRLSEAISALERAIALEPNLAIAHKALAELKLETGALDDAFSVFLHHAELTIGERVSPRFPSKIAHDRAQLVYMAGALIGAEPVQQLAAAAIPSDDAFAERFQRLHHIEGGERIAGPAIDPGNDPREIAAKWHASRPKLVVIDNLLSPDALAALRQFCWGSTIWRHSYQDGYVGAEPSSGFSVPLLAQIAAELRERFPEIFRQHFLRQCWAFNYDSGMKGTSIHADFAAVNVNFWITPDDANLDPTSGGLVVWDVPAPLDWDFQSYNANTSAMAIREFLARSGAKSVTVPYRANRAAIFDSDLFHETDRILFKEGYLNRRINVTCLYGLREHDQA
jgi:tetratricopeptide (TPR) repeat protein